MPESTASEPLDDCVCSRRLDAFDFQITQLPDFPITKFPAHSLQREQNSRYNPHNGPTVT
jgi:hypothetical protein